MSYWVAHTRGPNFQLLEKRGFVTFYPEIDDYVFLEATPKNEPLLKRQLELCVHFVKHKNEIVTITDEELNKMRTKSVDQIVKGAEIMALIGVCENLEGEVLERDGDKIFCRFRGFNRFYEREVTVTEVVLKGKLPLATLPTADLVTA